MKVLVTLGLVLALTVSYGCVVSLCLVNCGTQANDDQDSKKKEQP